MTSIIGLDSLLADIPSPEPVGKLTGGIIMAAVVVIGALWVVFRCAARRRAPDAPAATGARNKDA